MATHPRPTDDLYEEDFYVWTEVQADLLRARRFDAVDLEHLIEEVEGLGDAKKSAVLSNATVIVEHLLKLQSSPAPDPRSGWIDSVLEHRNRLEFDLTPRLRQILQTNCHASMRSRGAPPSAGCAPTAKTQLLLPCRPPALTPPTRSRPTGGPDGPGKDARLAGSSPRRTARRERRRGAQVRPARVSNMIRQARTGVAAAVGDRPTASA